jgi:phosphoglycolate phosphatase-like HAD superfamily hydrolase
MAYITKELALTEGEAERLWTVYNNYKNEIRSAKGETGDDQIKLAEAVLNIRKKYKNDFKKILGSDQRVNKLFVAEKGFMKILQNELRNRQGK